jgi:hypothetical protein
MGPSLLAAGFLFSAGGCATTEEPVPLGTGPTVVPLDAPSLAIRAGVCVSLDAGERPLGTSPEGDLWLVAPAAPETTRVRVLAVDGTEAGAPFVLPFPDVTDGQPWDRHRATVIAQGMLVSVANGVPRSLTFPDGLGTPRAFCGDPEGEGDAFVLADGVFEKAAGQWWRWRPEGVEDFGSFGMGWISRVDGACRAPNGALWVGEARPDGEAGPPWRLDDAEVVRFDGLDRTTAVAYAGLGRVRADAPEGDGGDGVAAGSPDSSGVSLLVDGELVEVSRDYRRNVFEAGDVDELASTIGMLWARVGDRVYARPEPAGTTWSLLDGVAPAPLPRTGRTLFPHAAGGLWIAEAGPRLCHRSLDTRFEVRGLRPREQRLAPTADLTVTVEDGLGPLEVLRDGAALLPRPADLEAGAVTFIDLDLGPRGPHALTLRDLGTGRTRVLPYVLRAGDGGTWNESIAPIFEGHCAGGPCHGPGPSDANRPDLSTFEDWVTWADTIAARVGVVGDMPPPAIRQASWGPDQIETIVAWIEGGMERGE